ncbi:MAG: glycosyltransferase, partial [Hyphomicrobium sp.]|nr:glycosyltransferase [Hyphomicrobium sp.]
MTAFASGKILANETGNRAADNASILAAEAEMLREIHGRLQAEIKSLLRAKDSEGAMVLIDRCWPQVADASPEHLARRAGLLEDAGATERSDALFDRLIANEATPIEVRVDYARRLRKRGLILRAHDVIRVAVQDPGARKSAVSLAAEIGGLCALLRRLEPVRLTADTDARILALHQAILTFRDRPLRQREPGRAGKLALVTGSLGPGGAERQIARIAANLQNAYVGDQMVGGVIVDQPVEIIVKSLKSDAGDFFAPEVLATGAVITELNDVALRHQPIDAALTDDLSMLLKLLPPPANYGVCRLAPHLADQGVDVASLWQDGAALFAALAALIAGVPTIHLSFRGLPPSIRRHLFRPEYEDLYRALAQVPGVQLHCNSKVTAVEYAAWLDLPVERFEVIYNGVPESDMHGSESETRKFANFVARTPTATRTIGGVFRLDTDKRPLLWVKLASLYAKRHPDTRFVIVGAGRMLARSRQLATDLGIGDQVLFVGNTVEVGYWMTQMDVLVLMSRYEGLPNVLIEAQMAGTMVVSTPAGGAAECFIEGKTGRILDEAEKPDLDHACDCIDAMVLAGEARQAAAAQGRAHA